MTVSDSQGDQPQGAAPTGGMPNVPIDPALAARVMGLYQEIDTVLTEMKVPQKERRQVEQNLMEAVAVDLLTRLGGKMSDEEKAELAAMGEELARGAEPNLEQVAGFFRGKFTQEELVGHLADATESVLKDFIKEMGGDKEPPQES